MASYFNSGLFAIDQPCFYRIESILLLFFFLHLFGDERQELVIIFVAHFPKNLVKHRLFQTLGTIPSPCIPHGGRGIVRDLFVSAHGEFLENRGCASPILGFPSISLIIVGGRSGSLVGQGSTYNRVCGRERSSAVSVCPRSGVQEFTVSRSQRQRVISELWYQTQEAGSVGLRLCGCERNTDTDGRATEAAWTTKENGTKEKDHEINEGVTAALAARDATRNGDDSILQEPGVRKACECCRECTYPDFLKANP
ncbi:hypothetical protein Tco_0127026 [Tanacetum coccineum]